MSEPEVEERPMVCFRCGHVWSARKGMTPLRCASPKCRSPYWNREKRAKKGVDASPAVE